MCVSNKRLDIVDALGLKVFLTRSSVKITPATKAHLLRCTLYLLLAVYANPFALAQQEAAEPSEARASPASARVTSQDFEPAVGGGAPTPTPTPPFGTPT